MTPKPGGCYNLRAGLQCFIECQLDFYGMPMFRGILLNSTSKGTFLWHDTGHYSPTRHAHELDIIDEIGNG
jgi:hypothetical protein